VAVPLRLRWAFGLTLAALIGIIPILHQRAVYAHSKRLREVAPGVLYRSGALTADGFRDAIARHGIKTIINLQDEDEDPNLPCHIFGGGRVKERELCEQYGVRYVWLAPDLVPRRQVPAQRPQAIDHFLAIMRDPNNHPVLIHCRAGLHRTGVMTAVYRMEFEGKSAYAALDELKANGFGEFGCTAANDYVTQYVLKYRPGQTHDADGTCQRVSGSVGP
jgi:protein tyrosine phosphatase (PTP) superfamily phosphohydrolase (DUF442 family)